MVDRERSESIRKSYLTSRDIFGLKYNEGTVVFEVEEFEDTQYKPFSDIGTLSSSSNSGLTELQEPGENDDILFIPKSKSKIVYHVGIGISPASTRMYVTFPQDQFTRGNIFNLDQRSSQNGDPYGYVNGANSPYNNPTVSTELVIPPDKHPLFEFYNPEDETVEPTLNIQIRKYKVNPLKPSKHKQTLNRFNQPGSPMPKFSVGTLTSQANFDMQNEWGLRPVDLS